MNLYGSGILSEASLENIDMQPFVEMIAFDDISRQSSNVIKEFCNSEIATVLQEKQVLNKGTMMRLSKADDQKRREKLICYQLAKADNNPNWKKMMKHRSEWKKYRDLVIKQYIARAKKIAAVAQKDYIKKAKSTPNTK